MYTMGYTLVRYDGVYAGKGFWKIIRHVVHPVEITSQSVEGASGDDGGYVAFQQAVFALGKESCHAQSRKSQDVVAAYLKE